MIQELVLISNTTTLTTGGTDVKLISAVSTTVALQSSDGTQISYEVPPPPPGLYDGTIGDRCSVDMDFARSVCLVVIIVSWWDGLIVMLWALKNTRSSNKNNKKKATFWFFLLLQRTLCIGCVINLFTANVIISNQVKMVTTCPWMRHLDTNLLGRLTSKYVQAQYFIWCDSGI